MFKVSIDPRVDRKIRFLSKQDSARIIGTIELFKENGFNLTELYLKKLTRGLWELRARKWRLLFGIIDKEAVIVSIFLKKAQKTPKKEIELGLQRLKEYL
jgi:phage-related protein